MTAPGISFKTPLLLRSPNWLGDAIMALPAARNLKTLLGTEPLTVAAPEKLAALWQACPFVDHVIPLTSPKSAWRSAAEIRPGKFHTAVLLPNSLRAASEALLAGISRRIGYARGGRRFILSKAIPMPKRNPVRLHQRYYYLDLIATLGAPTDDTFPALSLPTASSETPILAICPGAEYGPAKRWPHERFLETARHFIATRGLRTVIFGAANDAPICAELAAQLPEAENRAGQTTLAEFIAALAGAQLALCNDSGAMHLASALGVPTVAIFGSTEPQLTGPLGSRTAILRHHVPCSPCFLRDCPLDFACMTSVLPEMAITSGEALLKRE